ncbi:MAG: response regulator transcription factor [Chloroflexia bacterium]
MNQPILMSAGVVMPVRLLIVDDHEVVRQGLRVFLASDPSIEIVGEAADGLEALDLARDLHPEVVLMNLVMPRMDGITATALLLAEHPDTKVLILTSELQDERLVAAMRAGATGYLLKSTTAQELRQAIQSAALGKIQLAPEALAHLMQDIRTPPTPDPLSEEPLTERETATLRLLAQGFSNKEIASQLQVTEQTIKSHVHNLLNKLRLSSRTQAALYAVRIGLVDQQQVPKEPAAND